MTKNYFKELYFNMQPRLKGNKLILGRSTDGGGSGLK